MTNENQSDSTQLPRLARRHLLAGWLGLFVYLVFGIVLETLHGMKTDAYLGPANTTRRLMWTLAHAHGSLFALINVVFAVSLARFDANRERALCRAGLGLLGGLVILPAGFFLGGCWMYGGDPGPGIFLVPLGALLMLGGVGGVVLALRPTDSTGGADSKRSKGEPPRRAPASETEAKSKQKN